MACPECEKNKKKTAKDFTKAVVEIKNPDKLVLFRKVVVPASMGTEEQFPASVGKFSNVLLQYEANGDTYLYSSDGIPTQLSSDVSELQRQLDELKIVVTNEIADRIAADGTINSRIDQEILDRQAADNGLSDALAAEVAARKAADNTLDGKITTEKNARIAADNTLQTNINNEATARAAADNALDGKITTEKEAREAADQTLQTNINTEATTRANADTALGTRITNETTARQNADSTLDGKITTEANTRSAADSALAEDISAEVTRAKAAETALGGRIDDEATARAAADTTLDGKITTEATARANADSTLDGKITDEATARANADTALGTRITNETTARTNADTALGTRIDNEATARANADTAIENKLNRNVLYDLEMETDANNVTFVEDKINLKTGATTTERDVIPAASTTTAGTISASEYISLVDAEEKITALLEGAVAIDNLPANPTQQQLTDAWLAATGKDELINRASIYDSANQLVHTYYTNVSEWEDSPAGGQITIDQFTNDAAGIIKGSTTDGNVSANLDGTGTVSGWTSLKNTVAGKQDALTAGNNISISGSTISATDTTYSAGTGLSLTGTTFAVDTTTIAQKSDIPTVNNATLTIQKNGSTVKTFTANASTNVTANITVPTKTSDLTNDSNFPVDANYVHTDNNFTTALKNKLDGIAAGAEVNQNAFSNVKVGGTTVAADTKTDTLELVAGSNVTLTPDATNDKVTIAATDTNTTYTFANGTNGFTVTPSGGSAQTVTVTPSIANATTSAAGLMSAADKTKLNGIASGAEVNVQSDWSVTDTSSDAFIKNKPTIPTVNNATLTIQKNGTNVQTFTANSSTNKTANITVPTQSSDLSDGTNLVKKEGTFTANAVGSNLALTDTAGTVFSDVKLKGDTQQTTYTGKNLLDLSGLSGTTKNGVTISYDPSTQVVTLNGTCNTNNTGLDLGVASISFDGTYTLSYEVLSGTITNPVNTTRIQFQNTSTWGGIWTQLTQAGAYSVQTITLTATSNNIRVDSGVKFENYKIRVMIEKNGSKTAWEPYVGGVPAPNPDYPQEVETATGRQVVNIGGKNICNSKTEAGGYNNGTGNKQDVSGYRTADKIPVAPNTEYIWSDNGSGIGMNTIAYDISGTYISQITSGAIAAGHSFTTPANCYYVTGWRGSSMTKLQLEKGSTITAYTPCQGPLHSYEINLGKNLFDKAHTNVINGYPTATTIESNSYHRSVYIPIEPNTTYTVQKVNKGGNKRFALATYAVTPAIGGTTLQFTQNNDADSLTITTASNAKYLLAWVWVTNDTGVTWDEILNSLQIEKGPVASSYAPYFAPIELCKIGTYQDYIYPSGGKWYVHKEVGKIVMNGSESESWTKWATSGVDRFYVSSFNNEISNLPEGSTGLSSHFVCAGASHTVTQAGTCFFNVATGQTTSNGNITVMFASGTMSTVTDLTNWLSSNNVLIYYQLANTNPTDTEITNPLLVAQLDNFYNKATTYTNTTYIDVDGDLPVILDVDVFQNNLASIMAGINARFDRLIDPPVITMTTTDPGEGQTLADNHYIAVFE